MRNKAILWYLLLSILIIIVMITIIFSLFIGTVPISIESLIRVLHGERSSTEYNIFFNIRLPRILLGFAVGGALSVAGLILQGLFRNPLVEPYTIGISGGAALAVSLMIMLRVNYKLSIISLPIAGFIGSIIIIIFIYNLSIKKGIFKIQTLLLNGVMISFISASLIMLIMTITKTEELHTLIFWITGTLENADWLLVKIVFLLSILGLVTSYLFCHELNALLLGEEAASYLGINVERSKKILFIISSLLTGISVSYCGIIAFVGLVIPHILRIIIGNDYRILIASSYLMGASFLILCDTIARTLISPLELPVGVITGLVGGIIFIYVLSKKNAIKFS